MKSAIYEGRVRHRRFAPVSHTFHYRLFMMYLDLAELPALFADRWLWSVERPNVASFRRADHAGDPTLPLDRWIRQLVHERIGIRATGPIRLLTHLRYFGYVFNPVSFYFCYDEADRHVDTIVAEITNTPWGERHCYVLGPDQNVGSPTAKRFQFEKVFHISPFMDMTATYDWRFGEPSSHWVVHMENWREGLPFFDATMRLKRRELSGGSLARVLLCYPLMTAKVISAIHWQALKLWLKGAPVHPYPASRPGLSTTAAGEAPR